MTEAQTARPFLRFAGLPDCDTGTLKVSNGSAGNIIIGRNTVDACQKDSCNDQMIYIVIKKKSDQNLEFWLLFFFCVNNEPKSMPACEFI